MKTNTRKRPAHNKRNMEAKLNLLTQPLSIDLDINVTNKYLEELKANGGYGPLKANIGKKYFAKDYTKLELQTIKENLENLKRYVRGNSSDLDDSELSSEDLQQVAMVSPQIELGDTSDSENEFNEHCQTSPEIVIGKL